MAGMAVDELLVEFILVRELIVGRVSLQIPSEPLPFELHDIVEGGRAGIRPPAHRESRLPE
jgi:hypothetical protein